jgi:hypothetical protein
MKKAVEEGTVIEEKIPELLINCKNTVAMTDIYQFKGHTGSAFHGIFIATGGAETAFTAERDKLKLSAVWTAIHGATKGGIAAVDHFFNIFDDRVTGM